MRASSLPHQRALVDADAADADRSQTDRICRGLGDHELEPVLCNGGEVAGAGAPKLAPGAADHIGDTIEWDRPFVVVVVARQHEIDPVLDE